MELVIVLVLIGLSAALAAPSLSKIAKRIELRAAAQTISGILRYYRSEAVHKGKVQQILFDTDRREVRVQVVATDPEKGEKETEEKKGPAKKYALPGGIQMKEIKIPPPSIPRMCLRLNSIPTGGRMEGPSLWKNPSTKDTRSK